VAEVLPAVTRLPMSMRRSTTVPSKRRDDVLVACHHGDAVDLCLVERDLRARRIQSRLGSVEIGLLGFTLLLRDDAFGSLVPALVGRRGELRLASRRPTCAWAVFRLARAASSWASSSGVSISARTCPLRTWAPMSALHRAT